MIDHLVGRPSPSWKRVQVSLCLSDVLDQSRLLGLTRDPLLAMENRPG
jgi:hypothetical protein